MSIEKQQFLHQYSDPALQLLLTAERLFAQRGYAAVSTRMIAREAEHKNPSALHYHFGNKQQLIQAILDYRIAPVNTERLRRLRELRQRGGSLATQQLVELFVEPFAFELRRPVEDTYYISLLAQLYGSAPGRALYARNKKRARELHEITSLLLKSLGSLPVSTAHLRLQMLGRQTIVAVAEWNDIRITDAIELDEKTLSWRTAALIEFLVGGLSAPPSK